MPSSEEPANNPVCFRCGECCRRFQVLLNREEMHRLALFLAVSPGDFIARYADPRWPGKDKWLVRQENGSCPFLRGKGREFMCAVHLVKPQACREWEAEYSRPECRHGLARYWDLVAGKNALEGAPEKIRSFEDFLNHCKEDG